MPFDWFIWVHRHLSVLPSEIISMPAMLVAVAVVFRYAVMQARQATAAFGQLAPPTDQRHLRT